MSADGVEEVTKVSSHALSICSYLYETTLLSCLLPFNPGLPLFFYFPCIMGVLSELLYADDLVIISETIEELRNKFLKLTEAFESKGLKVDF